MARSIGEAAANAIESGFRLALDVDAQQRTRERQDRLDRQAEDERAYQRRRQERGDKLTALNAQGEQLRLEGQVLARGAPDAEAQQGWTEQVKGLGAARSKVLSEMSGYDLEGERKAGALDLQAVQAGDFSKLKPGQFTRALTVATKRPPADYLRADGKPAPIEVAAADFMEGMKSGDQERALRGLNVIFAPDLHQGIGEPSPHGGTIVGKRFENFVPDPKSTADDPRVIPTLRVYVNNGKREASGDEMRVRRAADPDAPQGATGWYLAPLTEDRSSRPDAKVRSIGMRDGMNFVGQHLQLVELMNRPEALKQLELDAQSGWNPQDYVRAQASMGIQPEPKRTIKDTAIPAGGSVLRTVTDERGNVVEERRIEGNPKPGPGEKRGTMQQQIDAIDELVADGTLTEDEGAARKKALAARVSTGTKAQGLGAAGAGGKGGGTDKAADKQLGRMLQSLKEDRLTLEKKKDAALAEYKAEIGDGATTKQRAAAKAAYEQKLASLNGEDKRLRDKIDEIDRKLEFGSTDDNGGSGNKKGLGSAKPAGGGKLTKDQAAKTFGF